MVRLSLTKLTVALGGAAVALTAGAGIASANPTDAIINTTCNYGQVIAALNATDPAAATKLNSSPVAQSYIRNFLAAPPPKRQEMAQQIQAMPSAQKYYDDINQVAVTCNNFHADQ